MEKLIPYHILKINLQVQDSSLNSSNRGELLWK